MRHLRTPLVLAALLGAAVTTPAFADGTPITYPPACDASKVSKADVDRAHNVYLSGKQFLDESNYDKAVSYFVDAYSIDCSVHPILPIIATAFERKGDKAEAVRALEEYLRRAPAAPDREHIERRIKNLNDQIARDQTAAPAAPPPTAAPTAPPAPPPAAPAPVTPPAPAAMTEVPPPPESRSPLPWVLVGVGGAALVGGGVVWLIGHGNVSSAEEQCGNSRHNCTPEVTASGNNGRTTETIGGIVAGAGVVVAGAGVLWYVLGNSGPARTAVSPVVTPGYAGLAVSGAL